MAKAQTIGYNYFVGMHFVLCHGPVDSLIRIQIDNRDAWLGSVIYGEIYIDKPELFGGKSREGGAFGYLDFEPGGLSQSQNGYLLSQLGDLTPAYRGVASVVLKQFCVGMNPYLKPWSFAVKRIHTRQDGILQWYDTKAEIATDLKWDKKQSMLFALDCSSGMASPLNAPGQDKYHDRAAFLNRQIRQVLFNINEARKESNSVVDICIVITPVDGADRMRKEWRDAQEADFYEMGDFIVGWMNPNANGGLDFSIPFDEAATNWFYVIPEDNDFASCNKSMFFIGRGLPNPESTLDEARAVAYNMIYRTDSNDPVNIYCINLENEDVKFTEQVDNTLADGVPNIVVSDLQLYDPIDDQALWTVISYSTLARAGTMNPAHIIRECLTDPKWGMGYQDSDIDDVSFTYAADTLYTEEMGMSILWDAESTIEEFIQTVCKHIDATVFVDRHTGLFVLKLIRADYDASTLTILTPDNVLSIADFTRPSFGELVNSVTISYHNTQNDEVATISVQDIALAQQQQVTINAAVTYDGFVNPTLVSKVAQRDLRSLSTPLISCTIVANQIAKDLNIGSVFKLTWPDYDIIDVIMRVTGVAFGDGKANRIRITCVQDVFSFPANAFIAAPPPIQPSTGQSAQPITQRMVFEVPYLQLVQEHGQTAVDAILAPANSPDAGYVGCAAARPSDAEVLARIYTNPGNIVNAAGGYVDRGTLDFCPSALLDMNLDRMNEQFVIRNIIDPENIPVGTWLQIDSELMSVQQMDGFTIKVKRAVLDTVPYEHAIDSLILFWDTISDKDETEYVLSDSVDVKLTSVSGAGELPLSSAATDTLVIGARAIRPYPPADVKVNGQYFPTDIPIADVVLTWVARNRLQQTASLLLGFTDPGITAEPNTLYTVRVYDHNDALLHEVLNVNALTYTVPLAIVQNMGGSGVISVGSVRDGWYSTYLHNIPLTTFVFIPIPPGDALDFVVDETVVPTDGGALNFNMGV